MSLDIEGLGITGADETALASDIRFDHVSVAEKYSEFSFDLHPGEVLCLVGTEGSGREAILRTIFGPEKPSSGTVEVKGKPFDRANAQEAVSRGVGYVPRERKVEGIVNGMNVYENMTLSQMGNYASNGILRIGKEKTLAEDWIRRLSIKTPDVYKDCGGLSGGNQQKFVLAKWRSGGSDVFLLDHPTRGLDIGATERAMRSVAVGRKNYLFVGSQTGGQAAAIACTLIETAKLNRVDPQAWLADTLVRIPEYKIDRIDDLLPWKTSP